MSESTTLVPAGSQTPAAALEPPASQLQVVAMNTEEMRAAQLQLVAWFRGKVAACRREVADANDNLRIAEQSGFKLETFKRAARRGWGRITYYEKCLAAVEAGYVIVPNMPLNVFAIRTTSKAPRFAKPSAGSWFPQSASQAAAGEGQYVDEVAAVNAWDERYKDKPGTPQERELVRTRYQPSGFDAVEFPVSVAQPMVMSATAAAMQKKVFDEIGLVREERRGDPIVLGRIVMGRIVMGRGASRREMSFLVAWYVDTREL